MKRFIAAAFAAIALSANAIDQFTAEHVVAPPSQALYAEVRHILAPVDSRFVTAYEDGKDIVIVEIGKGTPGAPIATHQFLVLYAGAPLGPAFAINTEFVGSARISPSRPPVIVLRTTFYNWSPP